MLEADQIIDLLVIAGAVSMLMVPVLALLAVKGWKAAHDARVAFDGECARHKRTRRRLADVEALCKFDAVIYGEDAGR